ncbi:MAG: dihydrolipoyl dehydrogenase [Lachnospiraceae bacterium]|nr:dihydrolipoyl dehydrogenase [Lachnospiraceae bacterium]
MEGQFDLIVIGAGPGGYVAAIKAAKLGLKTAVIENREVGGTCLNRGCIPAKAMIHASSIYREMQNIEEIGIFASEVTYDYGRILEYKEGTTRQLVQGIEQVLKANSVEIICGTGTLLPGNEVKVASEEGEELLKAKDVLLASGSRPLRIPIPGIDLPGVITSDDLFRMKEVPESLVMIGGGVISVEFATVYAALGTKVTILEAMPRLVPNMDKEISQNLKMILKKRGIEIHTAAAVQSIEQDTDGYFCHYTEKEKARQAKGAYVLCAVGRCANTDGLLGEDMTLELAGGRVVVDEHFATSIPHVYAIGDLIGGAQLAHAASAQGVAVAERLAGKARSIDVNVIPGCVYTDPEIASAGLTEDEAKEKGIEVETGKFIMSANGRSIITKEERGFIKVVADKDSHVILGAQMMCARATDMIGEFVTAITNQMTVSQLLKGMRAHPTYNEGIGEALEELEGGAIHVLPKKKR